MPAPGPESVLQRANASTLCRLRGGQCGARFPTPLAGSRKWALEHHPAAEEAHDRDSANPASQINSWHRAAQRFTARHARIEQRVTPCKRCGWRSLFFADGDDYIACRNPSCGNLMTEAEYQQWTAAVAESKRTTAA